jgi:hypothetical protein
MWAHATLGLSPALDATDRKAGLLEKLLSVEVPGVPCGDRLQKRRARQAEHLREVERLLGYRRQLFAAMRVRAAADTTAACQDLFPNLPLCQMLHQLSKPGRCMCVLC